jgi:hypothetical protein
VSLWRVEIVEFRRHELDFTSSGQGNHRTTAVFADGTEIINALDLFDTTEEPMQTLICGACGQTGCEVGNRIVVRRLEGGILLMPAFDAMAEGDQELAEYAPPYFVSTRGSAFIKGPALAMLAARVPFFADPDRWPPLTMRDSVRLLQWNAPARALGQFPERPRLREELIATASHGTGREAFDALEAAIAASGDDVRPVKLVAGESVFFYLEDAGHLTWEPLTFDGGRYRLALAPGVGVEPA